MPTDWMRASLYHKELLAQELETLKRLAIENHKLSIEITNLYKASENFKNKYGSYRCNNWFFFNKLLSAVGEAIVTPSEEKRIKLQEIAESFNGSIGKNKLYLVETNVHYDSLYRYFLIFFLVKGFINFIIGHPRGNFEFFVTLFITCICECLHRYNLPFSQETEDKKYIIACIKEIDAQLGPYFEPPDPTNAYLEF